MGWSAVRGGHQVTSNALVINSLFGHRPCISRISSPLRRASKGWKTMLPLDDFSSSFPFLSWFSDCELPSSDSLMIPACLEEHFLDGRITAL